MNRSIVVTGTDTGVGKTVFAAGLADLMDACYWKPIQSGLDEETDPQAVARLGGLSSDRILPERYRLKTPVSPHQSAATDGISIDAEALAIPDAGGRPLVIEGAGGLMVPLNPATLYIDVFARWRLPIVLCARTALGTINHSLLSLEALRRRDIELLGIAFIGDSHPESERAICEFGRVKRLGRLQRLAPLVRGTLREAFATSFKPDDFGI